MGNGSNILNYPFMTTEQYRVLEKENYEIIIIFFFFFSSYRPVACLFQCVSPSFHRSTSVSLPFRDSVMNSSY